MKQTYDNQWYLSTTQKESGSMRNIIAVYNLASVAEVAEGLAWYSQAHDAACLLADRYGVTVETAAAVIAVLSPAVRWSDNVAAAETVIRMALAGLSANDYTVQGYGQNKRKAHAIASTGDISLVSGEKVTSFYRNIINPLSDDVTVDRHAVKVWLGFGDGGSVRIAKSAYTRIADDYRAAAKQLGIPVASLQAITWLVYKRIVER